MFQIKAETKNLQLKFFVQPNVPQYIKTDEKKLRVCLINLLGNAIKFTLDGGPYLPAREPGKQAAARRIGNLS
jgi:signal transduction histidine kinase